MDVNVRAGDVPEGTGANEQPLDPYYVLQLHVTAPHDLVERAYWALVARAKDRTNGGGYLRLGQLNDAYATLINGERRLAFDNERGHRKTSRRPDIVITRRGLLSRKHEAHTRLNHYHLLHVDFDASVEIIDVAYSFARSRMTGSDIRTILERQLVDEAYAMLANPQRRAQYDRSLKQPPPVAKNGAAAPHAPSVDRPAIAPVEPGVATAEPAAVVEIALAGEPMPTHDAPEADVPEPGATVPAAPTEVAAPANDAPETAVPEHLAAERAAQYVQPVLTEPVAAVEVPPAPARAPKERRWPFGRSGDARPAKPSRDQQRADVIEAEGRRLLELGVADAPSSQDTEPEPEPVEKDRRLRDAMFMFVEGPQKGQRVSLTAGSLIFGASESADVMLQNPEGMIGAGHVRVWHRESDYMLHQLDSFSVTYVNGERLDLRLVILEEGDEIRIGPHVLIFEQGPPVRSDLVETDAAAEPESAPVASAAEAGL